MSGHDLGSQLVLSSGALAVLRLFGCIEKKEGTSPFVAFSAAWWGACVGGVARCCLVALQVVALLGYRGAARCVLSTLVRAETMVLLPVPLECAPYLFGHFQIPSFFHVFCLD